MMLPGLKSLKIQLDLSQNKHILPIRTNPGFEIDNMSWNKQTSKAKALYYAGNVSIYLMVTCPASV